MGWCSGQLWPSCQGRLHPEQKTVWHFVHGTAVGRPSVLGCTLHTDWHSSTGHQALLGSNFTPTERKIERIEGDEVIARQALHC